VANAIRAGEAVDSYLVVYDISNPKRLRKAAHTCEDFGYREQLFVFWVRVSATDLVRMRTRLYGTIDMNEDPVLFIPLTESRVHRIAAIGRLTDAHNKNDVVMILRKIQWLDSLGLAQAFRALAATIRSAGTGAVRAVPAFRSNPLRARDRGMVRHAAAGIPCSPKLRAVVPTPHTACSRHSNLRFPDR